MSAMAVAMRSWLGEVLARKSPRTLETYQAATDKLFAYLEAQQRDARLEAIKPSDCRGFLASLKVGHNSVAHYDRVLRAVFKRIEHEGRDDFGLSPDWHSPWVQVQRIQPKKRDKRPLTPEQVETLLKAQPRRGFVAARNYALVSLLALAGLRVSEALKLKLVDLNLSQRLLLVRGGKGDKDRVVYLPGRLVRVLLVYSAQRGDRGELVFPTRQGKAMERRAAHRVVNAAGRRSGVAGLHPHLLRHTYLSILLNVRNAPLKYAQEQAGHSDVATTMGYVHTFPDEGAKLADKFSVI